MGQVFWMTCASVDQCIIELNCGISNVHTFLQSSLVRSRRRFWGVRKLLAAVKLFRLSGKSSKDSIVALRAIKALIKSALGYAKL